MHLRVIQNTRIAFELLEKVFFKAQNFSIVLPAWILQIKERKQDGGISSYWVKKANKTISNHVFVRNHLTSNHLFYSIHLADQTPTAQCKQLQK